MSEVVGIVVPLVRDGSVPEPIYEIKRENAELDLGYPCIAIADCFSRYFEAKKEFERKVQKCNLQAQ